MGTYISIVICNVSDRKSSIANISHTLLLNMIKIVIKTVVIEINISIECDSNIFILSIIQPHILYWTILSLFYLVLFVIFIKRAVVCQIKRAAVMYSIKRAISIYTLYFTFVLSLTSTTFSHCVCISILLLTLVTGRRERIWAFKPIMIRINQHSFQSIFLRLGSNSLCSLPPMNHCDNTAEHQSFILCNHSTYSFNCDIHKSFWFM
jgi:hypothetical protein